MPGLYAPGIFVFIEQDARSRNESGTGSLILALGEGGNFIDCDENILAVFIL